MEYIIKPHALRRMRERAISEAFLRDALEYPNYRHRYVKSKEISMKKSNQKIIYDKENGVLVIELKRAKSVDSDIQGNAVIDYGKDGEVVRLNLYNFSLDAFQENADALKRFGSRSGTAFSVR